jgi:hypothetical protein
MKSKNPLWMELAILAALILTLVLPRQSQAQQYTPLTLSGVTNNIAASTTNTYIVNGQIGASNVFTLTKSDEMALEFTFTHLGTNTANEVFYFCGSDDGLFFDTVPKGWLTFTVPAVGTNVVSYTTNVYVGAIGYLGLGWWANTSTNAITNVVTTNIVTTVTATSTNYTTNVVKIPIVQAYKKPLRRN